MIMAKIILEGELEHSDAYQEVTKLLSNLGVTGSIFQVPKDQATQRWKRVKEWIVDVAPNLYTCEAEQVRSIYANQTFTLVNNLPSSQEERESLARDYELKPEEVVGSGKRYGTVLEIELDDSKLDNAKNLVGGLASLLSD